MRQFGVKTGFTIVELLIAIAIIGVLLAILLPAIHRVRAAAHRIRCASQMRQLGLALIRYHDERGALPMGVTPNQPKADYPYMTWMVRILPYIEQDALWQQAVEDYRIQRSPFRPKPHRGRVVPVQLYSCPADPRGPGPHPSHRDRINAVTSYLGVLGTDHILNDGALYRASATRLNSITDGTASTLLIGERPPSADFWFGWWYANLGMEGSGSPDGLLGVRERRTSATFANHCDRGPYRFTAGQVFNQCDVFHFWSLHPGGANFAMCDGSVHFLSYSADKILPALATRAGNETVELP